MGREERGNRRKGREEREGERGRDITRDLLIVAKIHVFYLHIFNIQYKYVYFNFLTLSSHLKHDNLKKNCICNSHITRYIALKCSLSINYTNSNLISNYIELKYNYSVYC